MTSRIEDLPWMMATPVRPAAFVALRPEHAVHAVATAGVTVRSADEDHVLSDLQTNPDLSVLGRLGSGRAGIHRGKYLKGIGRTRLAANWANPHDLYHHSGHQAPSGAIREWLVSVFLEAKGAANLVTPCEGILVKPIEPVLRDYLLPQVADAGLDLGDGEGIFASDLSLQAISVKTADFCRFSNLVWLSLHVDLVGAGGLSLGAFARLFGELVGESSTEPAALGAKVLALLEKGLENLRRFWELGVLWGSLHNNIAIDGRYVDLEGPALVGRPLVGLVLAGEQARLELPHSQMLSGLCEAIGYALYAQMTVWFFRTRLEAFAAPGSPASAADRELAHALAQGFVPREHVLFDRERLVARMAGWVRGVGDLGAKRMQALGQTLRLIHDVHFGVRKPGRPQLALRPHTALRAGPFTKPTTPHLFDFAPVPKVLVSDEADLVNGLLTKLDQIADADSFLREAEAAAQAIRAYCRP